MAKRVGVWFTSQQEKKSSWKGLVTAENIKLYFLFHRCQK